MRLPIRVTAFAIYPIQYQAPIWRGLAGIPGITLEVVFETDKSVVGYVDREFGLTIKWDAPLLSGYTYSILPNSKHTGALSVLRTINWIIEYIRKNCPDVVVITAYSDPFSLMALLVAKAAGARIVMRHEASDVALKRTKIQFFLRNLALRQLYQFVDGFAVIGTEARLHLLRHGVPASKLKNSPYCVDTKFFETEVQRWIPKRENIRDSLGISSEGVVLVFSGKLTFKKNPIIILDALSRLPQCTRDKIHLLVVGDGELRSELVALGRTILGRRFHLLGFLNQTEIGRAYACGDYLVLPSRAGAGETWGLVVNEALQFGLGVIVSDGVGCARDLVSESVGFRFVSCNADSLADAISACTTVVKNGRKRLAEECRRRASEFNLDNSVTGIAKSIDSVSSSERLVI
jgi:glycosyltransferase involved in cell wall biosynthesis